MKANEFKEGVGKGSLKRGKKCTPDAIHKV